MQTHIALSTKHVWCLDKQLEQITFLFFYLVSLSSRQNLATHYISLKYKSIFFKLLKIFENKHALKSSLSKISSAVGNVH